MPGYTSVRNRAWFEECYRQEHANKEIAHSATAPTELVNTYTLDWIISVEESPLIDIFLLEDVKESFEGWEHERFNKIDKRIRKAMKLLFLERGIYIEPYNQRTLADQYANLLTLSACPRWPEEELRIAMTNPDFRSLQAAEIRERTASHSIKAQTPSPSTAATKTAQRQATLAQTPQRGVNYPAIPPPASPTEFYEAQPRPPRQDETRQRREETPQFATYEGARQTQTELTVQPSYTRALTDLAKLYNDEMKFSGSLYDVLAVKLRIFHDTCAKVGIAPAQYHLAFSTMLSGRAQSYYYQYLAQSGMPFEAMVERMRLYFHTPENHQLFLNEWRSIMLKDIVAANPDKDLAQCLEIVIERLQRTYQGLVQNFGTSEGSLAGQLVSACQGVPACSSVLIQPASTFEGVAANLRSAVGIWMRCHANRQYMQGEQLVNEQAFYTDRRYNRHDIRRPFDSRPDRYNKDRPHPSRASSNRSGSNASKKCFICNKIGCWSTRHPIEERRRSRQRFQNYVQDRGIDSDYEAFLMSFEGIDIDDDDDDGNEDNKDLDLYFQSYNEQFLTSACGAINGRIITTRLNNAATAHAATGNDPYGDNTHKGETHLFTFYSRYGENTFQGIMPDTGAAGISTAGETQVKALQRLMPSIYIDKTKAGSHRIRFGDSPECVSLGDVKVSTPVGEIDFAVMPTNTPFLLCLADMDRHRIYLNNVDNVLVHQGKEYPIVRKWGHPWLLLDEEQTAVHYLTETELRQLHRRFGHPAADRLYKLLEKTEHEDVNKDILKRIEKYCHQCQLYSKAPGRFKFTVRDDIDFNFRVIVDIMYLNQKPVLHAVDEATAFQAARFLRDIRASTTWDTLRAMWIDMYIGPPDVIATDAGKNFVSEEFVNNANSMAIEVQEVPVEAHNSIGKVERYHAVIRRAYEIILEELGSTTLAEHILQMAVKAANDTAGPDGLVPTLLVFGTYPRLSKTSPPSPSITARAAAIRKATAEIRRIKATRQIADALATRNGPDTRATVELPLQSKVKVWRESSGWTGPHKLLAFNDDQTAAVVDFNGRQATFRTTVVRPYYEDEHTATQASRNNDTIVDTTDDAAGAGDDVGPDEDYQPEQSAPPPRRGRGRPKGSKNKPKQTFLTRKEQDDYDLAIRLRLDRKITTPGKPFEESTKAEIDALIAQGVFRFEQYDADKHSSVRIFKSRIVNEVKGKTTDHPYEKSRLVIQGYNDRNKEVILTQSPTIQRASQRLIVALAPSLIAQGMILWLRDITQAYTQSDDHLQRMIVAELPTQLQQAYPKDTVMVVIKPLYGIAEAGAYWWSTYFKHHTDKLEMETSTYDPCLLISKATAAGFGVIGMQTDDTLGLSNREFANKENKQLRFKAKERQELSQETPIAFNGCIVTIDQDQTVRLQQKRQGEKLENAHDERSYIQQRARGAYLATICQPEAAFDLAAAAQAATPSKEEISRLNKRIEWQKSNLGRGLTYIKLDIEKLKLFTFVDASFANNKDLSSQIGHVIVLGNETTLLDKDSIIIRGNILHWSSTKCKRITRSVLASEIYAMAYGVDIAIAMRGTINLVMKRLGLPQVPLVACTDSLSLYECLVKLGTTKEKRLMIDIMALREAYERGELTEIRWINGRDNPADSMTKASSNQALQALIDTNELELRVQGWVHRSILTSCINSDTGSQDAKAK